MLADPAFRRQQRLVAIGMAAAAIIAIGAIAGALSFASGIPQPFADRIATALKADLFVLAWLLAAIANVARLRFFSPDDIAGSADTTPSKAVRHAGAILQNTLEQVVLSAPLYLALAAILERPAPLIVVLVCLFCLGRALFWIGYAKGAAARAFGFALTFYPSAFSLLVAIVVVLNAGLQGVAMR